MDYTPNGKEVSLGLEQGKIQMIKEYRTRMACGLKEAKDQCEDYFVRNNLIFKGY
jgi:ribosomal protein L7/L12